MVEFYELQDIKSPVLGIRKDGEDFLQVPYSLNRFHLSHVYLDFRGDNFLDEVDDELLQGIAAYFQKPLQVMLSSRDKKVAEVLAKLGFERRRRCFEVVVRKKDYLGNESRGGARVQFADKGSEIFRDCSNLMLCRYIETHRDISPWTGSFEDFFFILPARVAYEKQGQRVENLAFIDEREIAYVCGEEYDSFKNFAKALIEELFEGIDELFFEADDNDIYAMTLKSLFSIQGEDSWDTYIFPFKKT